MAGAPPATLANSVWNMVAFGLMGAVASLVVIWIMLRRVPLWRTIIEPLAAGIAGATIGVLMGSAMLFLVLTPLGIGAAVLGLSQRSREQRLPRRAGRHAARHGRLTKNRCRWRKRVPAVVGAHRTRCVSRPRVARRVAAVYRIGARVDDGVPVVRRGHHRRHEQHRALPGRAPLRTRRARCLLVEPRGDDGRTGRVPPATYEPRSRAVTRRVARLTRGGRIRAGRAAARPGGRPARSVQRRAAPGLPGGRADACASPRSSHTCSASAITRVSRSTRALSSEAREALSASLTESPARE